MRFELKPERERDLIASIKRYFMENMDEEIGDLKAKLFLDYVIEEIGPSIYNQAIADAQAYLQVNVADMEISLYEPELVYWQDRK